MLGSTGRTLFRLGTTLALLPLWAGCTEPAGGDATGGSAGSSTTAGSGGSGGGAGGGGQAGAAPACDTSVPAAGAAFAPANGPHGGLFTHVAAASSAIVAAAGYGLHRSKDGGDTWEPVADPRIEGQKPLAIAALGDEIFVTIPDMVYRSTDGGVTWEEACTEACAYPSYLSSHGAELYLLDNGLPFRWDAAAAAWEALPEGENLLFDVLESDGQSLYANSLYQPGAYRLDLANTAAGWAAVPGLGKWGYRAFAFTGSHGFAVNPTELFRSEDGGATWDLAEIGPGAASVHDLFVSDGAVLAATAAGLWASTDQGATWTEAAKGAYYSGFALAGNRAHLFAAQRGLHRRSASGGDWQALPVMADTILGLYTTQTAVISTSYTGVFRTTDGGASWSPVSLPENQYYNGKSAVSFGGKIHVLGQQALLVSDDDGASFSAMPLDLGEDGNPGLLAAIDQGLVVGVTRSAGAPCPDAQSITTTLYVSKDGATWAPALGGFPTTFTDCYGKGHAPAVTSLVQSGDMLVAGTFSDGIFYSDDQGVTWHPSSADGEVGAFVEVTAVRGVLLAASLTADGVWRSEDGGKSWKKSGLDGVSVLSMTSAGDSVFAAAGGFGDGKGGVFHSPDLGATWAPIDAAFSTMVPHVAIQGDTLFAGTTTRSVWVAPLTCASAP